MKDKNLLYSFLIFTLVFFSCNLSNEVTVEKPEKYIEKNQFEEILYEVNVLEGFIHNFNLNQRELKDSAFGHYEAIYEQYGVSYQVFKET